MLKSYKWMVGRMIGWTEISDHTYSKSTCGANNNIFPKSGSPPLVSNGQLLADPPFPLGQQKSAFAESPPPLPADVICEQPQIGIERGNRERKLRNGKRKLREDWKMEMQW